MSHQQSLVLGTAGHIDHGKSTLIKALTGVDPDRLAEEKKRGITIELGFGEIETPSGQRFGVVDVPGHEKFVRHMVAGATGIDAALIVIAADDGVMVQTREHIAILELLGVTEGIVVITKIDTSDPELLELVEADIAAELEATAFADAPRVKVSSVTGEGLDDLNAELDALAARVLADKKARREAPYRQPVDRVFTIAGAGTVITGTLWEGSVAVGDEIEAVFAGKRARVRGVEVHGEAVERALPGNRVALNLASIAKDDLQRGEMLAAPGLVTPTTRLNVSFTYVGSEQFGGARKAFKSGAKVHIHHATRDVIGELFLFDEKTLQPGQTAFGQVRLEEPLAALSRDRFIARSFSPALTIGGGEVLDTAAPRRLKIAAGERATLEALARHDVAATVQAVMALSAQPLSSDDIAARYNFKRSDVAAALNNGSYLRVKLEGGVNKKESRTYFFEPDRYHELCLAAQSGVLDLHERRPDQRAFTLAELKQTLHSQIPDALFEALIVRCVEEGALLVYEAGKIAHAESAASRRQAEADLSQWLQSELTREGLAVSTLDELVLREGCDAKLLQKVANDLVASGELVRIAQKFYFSKGAIEAAEQRLRGALANSSPDNLVAAATLRDALGVSRKYAIPLLEYFDARGLTRRDGDGRYLNG